MEHKLNPELLKTFSLMPEMNFDRENLPKIRNLIWADPSLQKNNIIAISEKFIPGPDGAPDIRVKIYEPKKKSGNLPGVLYIHGGGYIIGSPDHEDGRCQELVMEVNCVVISVDYRLAPENPYPAGLEDCYASLKWFSENAEELGVDRSQIAIIGGSAGGGLTAALSLLARDRKGPKIAFQMPLFPMIDDRGITPSNNEITDDRVWNAKFNRQGWGMYLGELYGTDNIPIYAAPTRATNLTGLPPTYTYVGDLDPFCDETIDYVARLRQAGVPTEFHLYPGCFHGFDGLVPTAEVSKRANAQYIHAVKLAFQK